MIVIATYKVAPIFSSYPQGAHFADCVDLKTTCSLNLLSVVSVHVKHPSQQFFSHIGAVFCLPGLNLY